MELVLGSNNEEIPNSSGAIPRIILLNYTGTVIAWGR
jgi:hypothetical protein